MTNDLKTIESAVDRAERLVRGGADVDHAARDAGHFFSASSELVKSALQLRLQRNPANNERN